MDCVPCLSIHGGGCPAARTNEEGTPVCIFCEDRIPCAVQQRVIASGRTVKERAAYIETEARKQLSEIKRKDGEYMVTEAKTSFEAQTVRFHPSEVIIARESQEDPKMSTGASEITPRPSTARPTRICSSAGCQRTISYNNVSGECGSCQKRSSQRMGITESTLRHKRAVLAKPNRNGAALHDSVNGNGNGNGNGAKTSDGSLILMPRVESRVDMIFALLPSAEKIRLLSAYIAGTV